VSLGRQCGADTPDGILTVMSSGNAGFFDMSSTSYDEPDVEVVDNEACTYLVGAFDTDSDNLVIGVRVKYRNGTPGA
ncbi:MAG TPA: hypothetical protein VK960_05800, partial [Acidimicrobiia bacterium]|nr:hypothetical protein [Acidimicrobiia bacterium]